MKEGGWMAILMLDDRMSLVFFVFGGSTKGSDVKASLLAAERWDDYFSTTFNTG